MKHSIWIISSVGIATIASFLTFQPWNFNESVYKQEVLKTLERQEIDDAKKWLSARFIDQETGLPLSKEKLRLIDESIKNMPQTKSISFIEQGPDNIGGRIRAIQVDRINNDIVWTGGVSGGLFKSTNGGNTWNHVTSYEGVGSPFISSIAQFSNGTLFVATGSENENWNGGGGNGVWYSQDQGTTWTLVPETGTINLINKIIAPANGTTLWLATSNGMKKWNFGSSSLEVASNAIGSTTCRSISCTEDGSLLVAAIGSNKTYISNDGGVSWTDKSMANGGIIPTGGDRMEYAISHELNNSGHYSIYAVHTSSNLNGMYVSHDSGNTWSQFMGSSGSPGNLDIYRDQGDYNSVVSVVPGNSKKILIGGIDIWKWEQNTNSPISGGFEKLTESYLSPSSSKYSHADNHVMQWDGDKLYVGNDGGISINFDPEGDWYPANRGYNITQYYGVAFDAHGGVMGGAQDNGTTHNDHTGSTWHEFKQVWGGDGFQCEISFFNRDILFATVQNGVIKRSKDRGVTAEDFHPDSIPASYDDFGTGGGNHPFHTTIYMAEYYDTNSEDSIIFIPQQNYAANDEIAIPSMTTGDSIYYTTPVPLYFSDTLNYTANLSVTENSVVNQLNGTIVHLDLYNWVHHGTSGSGSNPPVIGDSLLVDFPTGTDTVIVESLDTYTHYYGQHPVTSDIYDMGLDSVVYDVSWDQITVQDPYQSWFLFYIDANGGELWGTRNALRLSTPDPRWGIIAQGIGSAGGFSNQPNPIDLEFSKDMNHLFVSTGGSQVHRIDGLGSLYSTNPTFETDAFFKAGNPPAATTMTSFSGGGGSIEGLGLNPNDPDDLVIFKGSAGISRTLSNATSGSPTLTTLGAVGTTSPNIYDGIIDRDDPNILVIGTSHGAFVSENGGLTWTVASTGFTGTPVFEVRQSWRTWNEGNFKPGTIYIATYGRGIWSSDAYAETPENDPTSVNIDNFKTRLSSYPNPANLSTNIQFELAATSDVTINVYNLSGHLVKSIKQKNMAKGTNEVPLNISDLSRGVYVVKFNAGEQVASTKLVKQ
ncbi:MAG: T9SS type A sorting domain-containing protein [Crocinitomicaceae bacterium]|nr:T9SS type A sorting domain-containing protein [Crocinitomicaceae bacterium]